MWQEKAEDLFFTHSKSVVDIAKEIGITRQTIAKHLKTLPGYEQEIEKRKGDTKERTKAKKKEWKRHQGSVPIEQYHEEGDLLKRQHEQDVKYMSHHGAAPIITNYEQLRSAYKNNNGVYKRKNYIACGAAVPVTLPNYIKG